MKNKVRLQTILLLLVFLLPITSSYFSKAEGDFRVLNLHLSWQNDVASTITMSWRTQTTTDSIVQYGLNTSFTDEEIGIAGTWHHVELTGLTPSTKYHYRVGNGIIWSDSYTFTSGHHNNSTKFVALGDSQGNTPECKWVAKQVARVPMDFMMFSGDFVEEAQVIDEYYSWFNNYKDIVVDAASITTLGNHEKNSSIYYTLWALPGNEEYYSLNYGPIHIITLHTYYEGYENLGGDYVDQANWLVADLEANQDAIWTMVMMHRPPFSSYPRNYEASHWYALINSTFTPIFEQYNVDLVLTGHEHGYERLLKNNVNYIISGGAGSMLYHPVPEQILNESIYQESYYNFLYLEVDENKFHVRAFRPDYSFMDQVILNKEDKPDLSFQTLPLVYKQEWDQNLIMNIVVTNTGEENISTSTTLAYTVLDTVETLVVPPLNIGETFTLSYNWSLAGPSQRTYTFELDYDSEINEVSEDNNLLTITFVGLEKEETISEGSFLAGLVGTLILMLSLVVPVFIKKRKKD